MSFMPNKNYSLFKKRREQVLSFLRQEHPEIKKGMVILFANFENDRIIFRQESSFYYLTGIIEPGAILLLYLDGTEVLYLPNYGGLREKWTTTCLQAEKDLKKLAENLEVSEIRNLGQSCNDYFFSPIFTKEKYDNFLIDIDNFLQNSLSQEKQTGIFTILDGMSYRYSTQIRLYRILLEFFPVINSITRDLAPLVHYLRRFKSEYEIDLIYKAIQITSIAHESAAQVIFPGRFEYEVQAIIESVFTQAGAMGPAFPSIIASGKNSTIIHYTKRDKKLEKGDLVVVDIGAEYDYYAADLTRTYPVSGKFTKRQLEIYNIVLQAQAYIESVAKPGMFLNNPKDVEKSLNHLAIQFFANKKLDKYFAHGIGHFLGLDVHDVSDNIYPISPGDVFTIEPGLYIPEEDLGIRIEDDYLMTDKGVICLSYQLPRKAEEIEKLMTDGLEN